jgi:hypothetical protein
MKNETLFTELLGSSPEIKTLDFLLIHKNYDYSLTEIARNSNVGWSTIHLFWKSWVKKKIVVPTRRIGRAEMYELNRKNPLVAKLEELHNTALKDFVEKEIEKTKTAPIKNLASNKIKAKASA